MTSLAYCTKREACRLTRVTPRRKRGGGHWPNVWERGPFPLPGCTEADYLLLAALSKEISTAPPSRLLTLIGQAIRWQKSEGIVMEDCAYDIVEGAFVEPRSELDAPVAEFYAKIKVGVLLPLQRLFMLPAYF